MIRRRAVVAVMFCAVLTTFAPSVSAEVLTVRELLEMKDEWPSLVSKETKLQVTGRLHARVASRLRLQKLDIPFIPERGITIPDRLRSGRRLTVSGRLTQNDNDFEFRVTRFSLGSTDSEEFADALDRLDDEDIVGRFAAARRFARIAEYYDDEELAADVMNARLKTVETQRSTMRKSPEQLWKLVDPGPGFPLPEPYRHSLAYEVFFLRSAIESDELRGELLKQYLPGWNHTASKLSDANQAAWKRKPVEFYDRSNPEVRRQLERQLYRKVRIKEVRRQLKSDGSNGLQLAKQLRSELPEEDRVFGELAGRYADYRLKSLDRLNRTRLREVVDILNDAGRQDDARQAVNDWTQYQEAQFADRGLEGRIRVADEYLFAFEQWDNPAHRDAAVDSLKRAWETARKIAPDEVAVLSSRLERLGWTRLHNEWLTTEEMRSVPADDIELAQREGRVVAGMSPAQVRRILGEPTRNIRTASSRAVEEIWVYGERHSSRITVRLSRQSAAPPKDARVLSVFQLRTR